jgi:hypothetical protein
MRTAVAQLESLSPLSWSRYHKTPKLDKELDADHEARTWRERFNTISEECIIPPMAFKLCIEIAARYLSKKIPGKNRATYTKHFMSGLLVPEPLFLGIKKQDLEHEWLFVPSNGRRGGGTRVEKCFPLIREWSGPVKYLILDETITPDVFEEHLIEAGNFIGVGRFRPGNGGFYGRFKVNSLEWLE